MLRGQKWPQKPLPRLKNIWPVLLTDCQRSYLASVGMRPDPRSSSLRLFDAIHLSVSWPLYVQLSVKSKGCEHNSQQAPVLLHRADCISCYKFGFACFGSIHSHTEWYDLASRRKKDSSSGPLISLCADQEIYPSRNHISYDKHSEDFSFK